jgi:hypothetical protein
MDITKVPLMVYLKASHDIYHGKVLELREAIKGWLNYIPQTFPHYTRHTVEHSDEIVLQTSKLLFRDDDPAKPVVHLSATEAYIVAAAAYLHDAGMVSSDKEKADLLESKGWTEWVTGTGGGAERWAAIQGLRKGSEPPNDGLRNFLADVQIRFLLAEFIRRTHHLRAADIMAQHQGTLGRFAFDDPMLLRTISDVCVAHGLRQHELEDRERYPEECDIRADRVNVRFLAILLRLGDLLDMSCDRACPLLLNPASPVPSESFAHWSQYQRIVRRLTSPERIEIRAECLTQEEHRVLQDWCQWLVNEVKEARTLMSHAPRHREWTAPEAELAGPAATIHIEPAPGAKYFPSQWRFELDKDVVFGLLVRDVYGSEGVFIRELLQNAFDANRCQMYIDLASDGQQPPDYPTEVSEERRQRYPVRVSIATRPTVNELSGTQEDKQYVVVEDCGIGMDNEIIQRYFLQVGRSFYVTDEFQRNFRFVPTSRFGVGFLTVFAVSDRVVVETFKPTSPRRDGPIRLTLTGPRNYLLTERGDHRTTGTRIEVMLKQKMGQGKLTDLVTGWCRRIEFPILVDDLGKTSTIRAERPEDFLREEPDVINLGAKFVIRCFPISGPGVEGELYVFAYVGESGESWARWSWAKDKYLTAHPHASIPSLPENSMCLHGIALPHTWRTVYGSPFSIRIDVRRAGYPITLARHHLGNETRPGDSSPAPPEATKCIQEVISEHIATIPLARSQGAWEYKQRLMDEFRVLGSFWRNIPDTVRCFFNREVTVRSVAELEEKEAVTLVIPVGWSRYVESPEAEKWLDRLLSRIRTAEEGLITSYDLMRMSAVAKSSIFYTRKASGVRFLSNSVLAFMFTKVPQDESPMFDSYRASSSLATFPGPEPIGFKLPLYDHVLLNSENVLVQWYLRVRAASQEGRFGLNEVKFKRLRDLLTDACMYPILPEKIPGLTAYLTAWRTIPCLPSELYPPQTDLTFGRFQLQPRRPRRHRTSAFPPRKD